MTLLNLQMSLAQEKEREQWTERLNHVTATHCQMTELWDARNVCQRDRRPASSSSKAASLALKRLASLSRWVNGSACEPSPIDEFARCFACNGSQMQSHCLATTQRNRTRALERKRPVRGSSIRHQVSTPRLH